MAGRPPNARKGDDASLAGRRIVAGLAPFRREISPRASTAELWSTTEKGTKADLDYVVALDVKTVEIIGAHRERCVERAPGAGGGLADDAYVSTRAETPDGSKPWHPDGANQRFNRIRAKVPGAEKVTPHQLRHWMATSMFADGYDPVAVAGRGGWSSPAMPMAVYCHFRPARDQAAADSLARRLDKDDR